MRNFEGEVFNFLSRTQGFYIKTYYSNFSKSEKWVAIKDLEDGVYAVIISKDSEEDINFKEAYEYMISLGRRFSSVSYTHLRAHETGRNLVCRLLLEKKKKEKKKKKKNDIIQNK